MAYFGSKYGSPNGVLRGPQDRVPVDPRGRRAQRAVNRPDGAPEGVQKWVHFGVQMGPPWVPTQDTPNTPNPRIRDIHLFRPVSHAWPKQGLAGSGRTLQIGVQKGSKTPYFGVQMRPFQRGGPEPNGVGQPDSTHTGIPKLRPLGSVSVASRWSHPSTVHPTLQMGPEMGQIWGPILQIRGPDLQIRGPQSRHR